MDFGYAQLKRWILLDRFSYSAVHKQVELYIFSVAGFFLPFLLGHSQLLVGSLVNAFLISAALKHDDAKVWPIVIMPSLGVLASGVIFGPLTMYLVYLIPFIWIGNYLIIYVFRSLKKGYWLKLGASLIAKPLFLFLAAYALFSFAVVPEMFLAAFGILQLTTLAIGGIIAFGYEKASRLAY